MKKVLFAVFCVSLVHMSFSQTSISTTLHEHYNADQLEILKLEGEECLALVQRDSATLARLWSKEMNFRNQPATRGLFNAAEYISITRENKFLAQVSSNVFMSIGKEFVVRLADTSGGSTIERKYTHIWSKEDGRWRLVAKYLYDPSN